MTSPNAPYLLEGVLMVTTAIFFCLWAMAIMNRHTDRHYVAIRYALIMLKEPDRSSFLQLWVKGHAADIADRFPGFEIYREQNEKSRA